MRVIRATDYRRMRWKNGLGETTEIAVHPDDATVDTFDWRLSMARVEADGPFSAFEGIDRTLSVLSGAGIRLTVDGRAPVELTAATEPYTFPGDRPTAAALLAGAITDLNVMTRRATFGHHVRRVVVRGQTTIEAGAGSVFVLCSMGPVVLRTGPHEAQLDRLDSAYWSGAAATVEMDAATSAEVFLVEIHAN